MAEEIRQTNALTDEEKQQLFGWGENIFGVVPHSLHWRSKDFHFLWYADGKPLSHVGVLKHVVRVDGAPVTVGGVGGVVTTPGAQRQGFARRLMEHAARFLEKEWAVDAGLLFCLPTLVSYYAALGWQETRSPVLIEQPGGPILSPMRVMVLPFREEGWPPGRIEIESLPW